MKNLIFMMVYALVILLSACSSKGKSGTDDMQILMQDSVVLGGPQRMQVSEVNETFIYKGKEYRSSVLRRPDETLPVVQNDRGEKFVDNRITLQITAEGKIVIDKVFTKETFASLVDAKFMKYAILEGLVYDKVSSQGIVYAASVCYPQSDLYVPLKLTVTSDGKMSIAREELLDESQVENAMD